MQKHLTAVKLHDPFATKNSFEVVSYLKECPPVGFAFSVDVTDLFYSIPHQDMFFAVRECIEDGDVISFQNSCGMTLDNFMTLLEFYLQSTFVSFRDNLYVQRRGVCIGSCVAPVLCDMFLARIDQSLEHDLEGKVLKVFRYVDDFLIILKASLLTLPVSKYIVTANEILEVFQRVGKGLSFTNEMPSDNCLQFLDLNLTFLPDHVCWIYKPRVRKGLLPYESAHSKTVKRAVAMACLQGALVNSCHHRVRESFVAQVSRLLTAGFPLMVLIAVAESLLKKIKCNRTCEADALKRKTPVVLPYVHKVAHNLKNVANRHGVPVVFSAPRKLAGLCPKILKGSDKAAACQTKHATPFVRCATGVVYSIPLTCGKVYIGQTGRCINDRLREHQLSIKNKTGSHLPHHCLACEDKPCRPLINETTVLGKGRDRIARELMEAFFIRRNDKNCVSVPSVALYGNEFEFLKRMVH